MVWMVIRRFLLLVPILIGLTLLLFVISRLLPGDPVQLAAGPHANASDIAALKAEFGLDQPVYVQYWRYLTGLLHGDFGRSVLSARPVAEDIASFLPATIELVVAAMLFAIVLGVPLGLLAAVRRQSWIDYFTRFFSLTAMSTPQFFLGLLLQIALGMFLPIGGRFSFIDLPPPTVTGFYTVDSILAGDPHALGVSLAYLLLPALTLGLSPMATFVGMMRAATLDVMQQDYVRTARAFGLPPRQIVFKYVLKNAIASTLTLIGLYFGWLLGGTVVVETVFDWPGIGLYATKAIVSQDFSPVIGVALVVGTIFVIVNIVVDIMTALINPKLAME